jgi:RHS repeat-associated protein
VSVATEGSKDASGNGAVENGSGLLPAGPTLQMATTAMTLEYTSGAYAANLVNAGTSCVTGKAGAVLGDVNGDGLPDLMCPADSVLDPGGAQGANNIAAGEWLPSQHRVTFTGGQGTLFPASPNPYPECPIDAAAFLADGSASALGRFSARNELLAVFHGSLANCVFAADSTYGDAFTIRSGQSLVEPQPTAFDIQGAAGDVDGDGLLDLLGVHTRLGDPHSIDVLLAARKDGQGRLTGGFDSDWGEVGRAEDRYVDMDGDGCADHVFVGSFPIVSWHPSECNGWFHRYAPNRTIAPTVSGVGAFPNVADVDGDGLADLVGIVGSTISISLNNGDGRSFGGSGRQFAATLPQVPSNPTVKLTFGDMNGSGTTDVVVLRGNQVFYVDLLEAAPGVPRPYQLKSITNGLGAKTTVTYARGTDLDKEFQWSTHSPVPFDVVRTVETTSLSGISSAAFFYYDPVYDGWNQRFRGFRRVRVRTAAGTDASALQHQHRVTYYLIGSCGSLDGECPLLRDPEQDTLTTLSLPYRVDMFGDDEHFASLGTELPPTTTALSTSITSYVFSSTKSYLDWHVTTQTRIEQVDTIVYDPSGATQTAGGTIAHGTIGVGAEALTPVTLSTPTSSVSMKGEHLRRRFEYDAFGNPTVVHDDGRVGVDRTVDTITDWDVAPSSVWTWRPVHSRVPRWTPAPGDRPTFDREMAFDYDSSGRVIRTSAYLDGVVALDRHHENPNKAVAPAPTGASQNGWYPVVQATYDAFGNLATATDATGGCRSWGYDKAYGALPVTNSNWLGGCDTGSELRTTMFWDRGFGVPLRLEHPDGRVSTFAYDAFGRVEDAYVPDPQVTGLTVLAAHFHYFDPVFSGEAVLPARIHATGPALDAWTYLDGFGKGLWSLRRADPSQGDGGDWTVEGYFTHASDRELRSYDPWFYNGDPSLFIGQGVEVVPYTRSIVDPFGRATKGYDRDGTVVGVASYHGLVTETADEAGQVVTSYRDGHGQLIESRSAIGQTQRVTSYTHLATGEVAQIREYPANVPTDVTTRWMAYDSLGHLVENGEPNSTKGFGPPSNTTQVPWRYAYDLAGRVVGTSDARGCGKNVFWDTLGRAIAEDWSPCLDSQADYTAPNLATGEGTEQFSVYDAPEAGQPAPAGNWAYRGHLVATYDRGAHTQIVIDGRARAVASVKWIAKPGATAAALASRYAPHAYRKDVVFDLADRITNASSGADVSELLANGQSNVTFGYTARGALGSIGSSYGTLAGAMTYAADGLPTSVVYQSANLATATTQYDARRRVDHYQLGRTQAPSKLADDVFHYDTLGNISAIDDLRIANEWPTGAKPVSRSFQHDVEHRLTRVDYAYSSGVDSQVSPFAAEEAAQSSAPVPRALLSTRPTFQSFGYDVHGRPSAGDDDQHAPWDRSIAAPTYGLTAKPHAMTSAANGKVVASYDVAGNTARVDLDRLVSCSAPSGKCAQVFAYDWDEVGQLVRARRWDVVTIPSALPVEAPVAELRYTYSGGTRVVRENRSGPTPTYFVDVFSSLRLENATWTGGDYERTKFTESVYLTGFARLIDKPIPNGDELHVVFTFGDSLGSTASVVDGVTRELMERVTYQAMGATDSDYRPAAWGAFRESFRFTGKEDDVEVGLQYFGARYYAPNLGRWLSPDPLMVHGVGPELDVYNYVGGRLDSDIDPNGLCAGSRGAEKCPPDASGDSSGGAPPSIEIGSGDFSGSDVIDNTFYPGGAPYVPVRNVSVSFPSCNIARGFNILGYSPARPFPWSRWLPPDSIERGLALFVGATVVLATAAAATVLVTELVFELPAAIPAIVGLLRTGNYGPAALAVQSTFAGTGGLLMAAVDSINNPLSLGGSPGGAAERELVESVEGAEISGARGASTAPWNPDGSRTGCVNGVCGFLNSVKDGTYRAPPTYLPANGGSIAKANGQIAEETGVQVGLIPQTGALRSGYSRQFFIVYRGTNVRFSDHVAIGIVNNGRSLICDPQTGQRFWNTADFGSFTAYPVRW